MINYILLILIITLIIGVVITTKKLNIESFQVSDEALHNINSLFNIDTLRVDNLQVNELKGKTLTANNITSTNNNFTNLTDSKLTVNNISANNATFDNLSGDNLVVANELNTSGITCNGIVNTNTFDFYVNGQKWKVSFGKDGHFQQFLRRKSDGVYVPKWQTKLYTGNGDKSPAIYKSTSCYAYGLVGSNNDGIACYGNPKIY